MHVQGSRRRPPLASSGDLVQERQRPNHTYIVREASAHHVVLEHETTGLIDEFGRSEFASLFRGASR